jgi:GDP-4-dehydro-6-deoxy-D-mannose reductase
MRCLVTGATGFVGGHLIAALRAAGHEVIGLARRPTAAAAPIHAADLSDVPATESVLRQTRPDWVFHLAGYADAGKSFADPAGAWAGNLTASLGLYSAVRQSGVKPRILHVSTGLVYGDARPGEPPPTEDAPLRPASPYAASKAAADLLAYQQTRNPGLDIVRVRPFNQLGPGQPPDYFAARFASQIAAAERGAGPPVVVAKDLSPYRDLTDVRDVVRAYIRLLEVGRKGEAYNAGSGRVHQIRDVLARMVQLARVPVTVDEQGDPSRAGDTAVAAADTRKLRAETGWEPTIRLDQTLADILDYWRRQVQ